VGGWLLGQFGFHFDGWIGSLVTALIGAIIVIAIVNLIKKHR
ncbi:MAG: GlsB/YeaQ/YmgE family stress response membrane protein, partial [Bacteroidales bacterium]|nr:GlsB/YeaQ/YmgE family stress response membrane protein [Bacteroidales bacterium]